MVFKCSLYQTYIVYFHIMYIEEIIMKTDLRLKYLKTLQNSRAKDFITETYYNQEVLSLRKKQPPKNETLINKFKNILKNINPL